MNSNLRIEIDKNVNESFRVDVEKTIRDLLKVIPPSHIANLEKIKVVLSYSYKKDYKNGQGFYVPGSNRNLPYIILCIDNIYKEFPPFFLKIFPFLKVSFLADVLFHEIGHHYQRATHGINSQIREKHAEKYSLNMKARYFYSKGFGKMIYNFKIYFKNRKKYKK